MEDDSCHLPWTSACTHHTRTPHKNMEKSHIKACWCGFVSELVGGINWIEENEHICDGYMWKSPPLVGQNEWV